MQLKLWNRCTRMQRPLTRDEGQDLFEYALMVGLIALAATAAVGSVANSINTAFTHISTKVAPTSLEIRPHS